MMKRVLTLIVALWLALSQAAIATTPPTAGSISNSANTQGTEKTYLEAVVSSIREMPGGSAEYAVTLSGDAFTPPNNSGQFKISAETGVTDNLAGIAITNVPDGREIVIRANTGHTITIVNGASLYNIVTGTGSNVVMAGNMFVRLRYDAQNSPAIWRVTDISWGDQTTACKTYLGLNGSYKAVADVETIARGGTNNNATGVLANGIMAGDGSKIVQITGTALQQFRVNAGATAIEPFTASGSAPAFTVQNKTSSFSAAAGYSYTVDATSANVTCTLPTAVGCAGQEIFVSLRATASSHTLILNTTSGQTIDNQASGAISTSTVYRGYKLQSDGANWELE